MPDDKIKEEEHKPGTVVQRKRTISTDYQNLDGLGEGSIIQSFELKDLETGEIKVESVKGIGVERGKNNRLPTKKR